MSQETEQEDPRQIPSKQYGAQPGQTGQSKAGGMRDDLNEARGAIDDEARGATDGEKDDESSPEPSAGSGPGTGSGSGSGSGQQ